MFTVYDLYTPEEAGQILNLVGDAEWKPGRARTPELTEALKHNEELQPGDGPVVKQICRSHGKRLSDHPDIKRLHLVKGISPPKFNRYTAPAGSYERHTDAPSMAGVRTDLACTTFLADPATYEGGELVVEDPYGAQHAFKGEAGQCVVYPCGQQHWVNPVTRGERVSIVCWIQSHVREIARRQLLIGMMRSLQKIESRTFEDPLLREVWTELGGTHASLFKMWME